jgi:hypothetical protein
MSKVLALELCLITALIATNKNGNGVKLNGLVQ